MPWKSTTTAKPCDYCGRTDWGCENEAQVIGCGPMPAHEPTPRQMMAEAIHVSEDWAEKMGYESSTVRLTMVRARAVLAALQEANRLTLAATMPSLDAIDEAIRALACQHDPALVARLLRELADDIEPNTPAGFSQEQTERMR